MLPIVHFLGRYVGTYSICAVVGFLACGFAASILGKKRKIGFEDIILALLSIVAGLLIGGHLLYGIVNWQLIVNALKTIGTAGFIDIVIALGTAFGGSVFYGGFLGGIVGVVVFCRIEKNVNRKDLMDIYAISVPLFHTFGRIGCFLGGCCYGIESSFGFTAHGNTLSPGVNDVNRFPVQLFEAALNLILFFVMLLISRKIVTRGKMIFIYMLIYPVYRFVLEFFRGDVNRGLWLGLSTSQWVSIILLVVGICGLLIGRFKSTKAEAAC